MPDITSRTIRSLGRFWLSTAFVWGLIAEVVQAQTTASAPRAPTIQCRLIREVSLDRFGGIPFCVDLDGDGKSEVLWLQSPGMFGSKVFDVKPWKGRFSQAEQRHFCLTATDATGKVLWQIGHPWTGSRPFVTHGAERALDWADLDADGSLEIVCARGDAVLVIEARSGRIRKTVPMPADNAQIVRIARTGAPRRYTILVQNSERAYPPHDYANPAWFFDADLRLILTRDHLGSGHAPLVYDVDDDGRDEFIMGYNLVDHDLTVRWTYQPVPPGEWNAGEMHVDGAAIGTVSGRLCAAFAGSDIAYLLDARTGKPVWKRKGTHPQHVQIGRFDPRAGDGQVFVHNKRAELQLFDIHGNELWRMTPPLNFPLGRPEACRKQLFHVFDPTTLLRGLGADATDLLIFTDGGWPYVIDGWGRRCAEFPHTPNIAQEWGDVPGRPDDYGYGFYARSADIDGDRRHEVIINDRRYAWIYHVR